MPFFDQYPYTNFHNVNLDWVLERVKEWGAKVEENNTRFENLLQANEDFKTFVTTYLENLDIQAQIDDKLDRMFESGELTDYLQPYVSTTVTDWLEENITQPEGVVIDSSLTVAGACADAKATGVRITESAQTKVNIQQSVSDYGKALVIDRYGLVRPGVITDASGLTDDIKLSLLACFKHVLWEDDGHSADYYNALQSSLFASDSRLTAAISYGNSTIFTDDPFAKIKWMLKVYYDGEEISPRDYTLSGDLIAGQNVLTITYNGESTSIMVRAEAPMPQRITFADGELLKYNGWGMSSTSDGHIPPYLVSLDTARVYYTTKGHAPFNNASNSPVTGVYPVPIPAFATHVRVSVAPNNYKIALNCWRYNNSGFNYSFISGTDTGFNVFHADVDIPQYPDNARALNIVIAKPDTSAITPLQEPTQVVVFFS